jgi:hypothetical protein
MTNFQKKLNSLTEKQIALARKLQAAKIVSYSKVIKALADHDDEQVAEWKRQLNAPKPEQIPVVAETPAAPSLTSEPCTPDEDYQYPYQAVNAARNDPWAIKLGYYIVQKANGRFDYGHAGHGKLEEGEEIWR